MPRRGIQKIFAPANSAAVSSLKSRLQEYRTGEANDAKLMTIPLANVKPLQLPVNLRQPRLYFEEGAMERLKASISQKGVLVPIIVREAKQGWYEIIDGERRYRCCLELTIKESKAVVITDCDDVTALELALSSHFYSEGISLLEKTESIFGLLKLRLLSMVEMAPDDPIDESGIDLSLPHDEQEILKSANKAFRITKKFLISIKNFRDGKGPAPSNSQEMEAVEALLAEFDIRLNSFVSNRIPLLEIPTDLLQKVRQGLIKPANAMILARLSPELQAELLPMAGDLSKTDLKQKISERSPFPRESLIVDNLVKRFQRVARGSKKLPADRRQEIIAKFNQLEALLSDLEDYFQVIGERKP